MPDQPTPTSDITLSNSFLTDTMQICVVTRDIYRTMDGMIRLGIGPWAVYTFDDTTVSEMTYRGGPGDYSMKLCLAFNGSMMWEIIEPNKGPSIYTEFLEKHGEGIHHTAFHCGDMSWQERVEEFEQHLQGIEDRRLVIDDDDVGFRDWHSQPPAGRCPKT